jgi:hypothetical protein
MGNAINHLIWQPQLLVWYYNISLAHVAVCKV